MITRLPRDLHPGAWWCWALGLAVAASFTTNPVVLILLVSAAALVVAARRSDQPWSGSFRLYLALGAIIVVIRVAFRVLLGDDAGGTVLFGLPTIPLPAWVAGISLLGPVTVQAVLAGLYEGLRLAALVVCVGAANALANPKRLLKSMPPALYEVGTSVVVAVSVLPQLSDSLHRVRAAQALRGGDAGRVARLRRTVVPVMEDALERSLALAAGMDVRGYGRGGTATRAERRLTGTLMLAGLAGICVGVYALLDATAPRLLAMPMLVLGVLVALAGFVTAGRRVHRSRYRPERWRYAELVVALSGAAVAIVVIVAAHHDPSAANPGLVGWPLVTPAFLAGTVLATLPALMAPPAVLSTDQDAS